MFKNLTFSVLWVLFLLSYGYCDETVSLMSYNVENLFDATDDGDNQGDPAFLPLSIKKQWLTDKCQGIGGYFGRMCRELDWVESRYVERLEHVANLLLNYNDHGADIIMLYEIENARVMYDLWKHYLKDWGYKKPFHFESPSFRGIDVGVISRLKLASSPIAHLVDLSDFGKATRDIIDATYKLKNGKKLRIAANHWPSPNSDTQMRMRAADVVKDIAYEAYNEGISFVAMGDFNSILEEDPNPISDVLANNDLSDIERPLVDLQHYFDGFSTFPYDGTHVYQGKWNPLDRALVSKDIIAETGDFRLEEESFDVFQLENMLTNIDPNSGQKLPYYFPNRYDFFKGSGFSDHLPLVVKLQTND